MPRSRRMQGRAPPAGKPSPHQRERGTKISNLYEQSADQAQSKSAEKADAKRRGHDEVLLTITASAELDGCDGLARIIRASPSHNRCGDYLYMRSCCDV